MKMYSVPISSHGAARESTARLDCILQEPEGNGCFPHSRPAVLVLPGGGYVGLSPREAEPIALAFAARGFQTFVLYYTLLPVTLPAPLLDAAEAMTWIRTHAAELDTAPDRIAVCGFSAGGHLAGSLGVFWNDPILTDAGFKPELVRPDAMILGYAALCAGPGDALESFGKAFLGNRYGEKEMQRFCAIPSCVTPETPPAFLWHTANDPVVPVENSLKMALALAGAGVPFALRVYPDGPHGLALANELTVCEDRFDELVRPDAARWTEESAEWLRKL